MASHGLNLDDPAAINNFLAFMPKRQEAYESGCIDPKVLQTSDNVEERPEDERPEDKSLPTSATATPAEGHRAPPPTPASIAAAIGNSTPQLECVPEDELLEDENVNKFSPKTATILAFDAFTDKSGNKSLGSSKFADQLSTPRTVPSARNPNTDRNKAQQLAKETFHVEKTSEAFQDEILQRFRKVTEATVEAKFDKKAEDMLGNSSIDLHLMSTSDSSRLDADHIKQDGGASLSPKIDLVVPKSPGHSFDFNIDVAQEFKPKHVTFDISAAKAALAGDNTDAIAGVVNQNNQEPWSGKFDMEEDAMTSGLVKVSDEVVITAENGQERENATFFPSWGAPELRTAPRAEVRRVILVGLPAAADNSLVASLMHGGALESFNIVKLSDSAAFVNAIVTFTNGGAAKRFYDKYDSGLVIKLNGRKYVANVQMGENVDVVSGVMRGYIETGASRLVRAAGADEDWGMRALRKMAEGKGRKVESIIDTYKDETRTIEFRFTNIADAVAFRGHLIRDVDWEDCTISFGEDPCSRAVGPRKE